DIPSFNGDGDLAQFQDWVRQLDRLFEHKGFDDRKSYKYAILRLTQYASLWLESTKASRNRKNKPPINTWTDLKRKMRRAFLPADYEQEQYLKLQSLEQGNLSVHDYTKDFERLGLLCNMEEREQLTIARYIKGLNRYIANRVETCTYHNFTQVCNLARKIEKQSQERSRYFGSNTKTPLHSKSFGRSEYGSIPSTGKTHNAGSNKSMPTPPTATSQGPKATKFVSQADMDLHIRCFKCQGRGHIAKNCQSKRALTLQQYYDLDQKEQLHEFVPLEDNIVAYNDVQGSDEHVADEDESPLLVLIRVLHATYSPSNTQWEDLFHSHCKIQGNLFSLIIDSGSCTNIASDAFVTKVNLPVRDHPSPYKLNWFDAIMLVCM
ncbi:Non-structural maintenance of chromosomes element 1-like protein, partial [Bienertia sinuspersici]